MNEQQRLRRHISAVQFAMWELHLYLDSHPYCKEAAKKLAAYREEYDKLTAEYEKAYGPLNETSRSTSPLGVDQRPVAVGNGGERVMWIYEKKLQYPVRIKNPNPALAKLIISQYGGPHGELGASLRYLSQRYSMPYPELRAILTDIGISVSEMPLLGSKTPFEAFATA